MVNVYRRTVIRRNLRLTMFSHRSTLYDRLFDAVEPGLADIFPGSITSGEDMYVWQFLAAMGVGASETQQQRLVMAVR